MSKREFSPKVEIAFLVLHSLFACSMAGLGFYQLDLLKSSGALHLMQGVTQIDQFPILYWIIRVFLTIWSWVLAVISVAGVAMIGTRSLRWATSRKARWNASLDEFDEKPRSDPVSVNWKSVGISGPVDVELNLRFGWERLFGGDHHLVVYPASSQLDELRDTVGVEQADRLNEILYGVAVESIRSKGLKVDVELGPKWLTTKPNLLSFCVCGDRPS